MPFNVVICRTQSLPNAIEVRFSARDSGERLRLSPSRNGGEYKNQYADAKLLYHAEIITYSNLLD